MHERTFTPAEFAKMIEAGIFADDEHVELLEGHLFVVPPQGPEHDTLVTAIRRRVEAAYGPEFFAREEKSLRLVDGTPQPDILVVRGSPRDYFKDHPRPDDVVLLLEVAVSSHAYDRYKARSYARAQLPQLWLLDVPHRTLEIHRDPRPDARYGVVRVYGAGDEVTLPGTKTSVRVGDLLEP